MSFRKKKKPYQVRVHVIEARELKGRDSGGMSDPVCRVTCFDKKQSSDKFENCLSAEFDKLFFWEKTIAESELETAKLTCEVWDANAFKDTLIGGYEFDLNYVYNQYGHELWKTWVALADTTGKYEGIQGYVNLSISVLADGDEPVEHDEDEDDDDDGDLGSMVLMPPNIATENFYLICRIYRAEGIPKMDTFGATDAYVRVTFGSEPVKTSVRKKTLTPVWNEEVRVPVKLPAMSDLVRIELFDHDTAGSDDLIATSFISFDKVMKGEIAGSMWINFNGAPKGGFQGKDAKAMNQGKEPGTSFRGRVLCDFSVEKTEEEPKASVNTCYGGTEPPLEMYVVRFDVFEAIEVPTKHQTMVELCVGENVISSGWTSTKKGKASWYKSIPDKELALPADPTQLPTFFINLYSKGVFGRSRLGVISFDATKMMGDDNDPQWELLFPDKLNRNLGEGSIPGFLLFRLNFVNTRGGAPVEREEVSMPEMQTYELRAHLYQARGLPAADPTGTSDPYCEVRLGDQLATTTTKPATCFPIWYESVVLEVELPTDLSLAPNINVLVYDEDEGSSPDLLGRISESCMNVVADRPAFPTWYPVYMSNPSESEGELLASFQLIPIEEALEYPEEDITPPSKPSFIEINAVGLRNLISVDRKPITESYLTIDCGDIDNMVITAGSSTPNVENPNFLTTEKISVDLPRNPMFAPYLNIKAFDTRGGKDLLLGATALPVGPMLPWGVSAEDEKLMRAGKKKIMGKLGQRRKKNKKKKKRKKKAAAGDEAGASNDIPGDVETLGLDVQVQVGDDDEEEEDMDEDAPLLDNEAVSGAGVGPAASTGDDGDEEDDDDDGDGEVEEVEVVVDEGDEEEGGEGQEGDSEKKKEGEEGDEGEEGKEGEEGEEEKKKEKKEGEEDEEGDTLGEAKPIANMERELDDQPFELIDLYRGSSRSKKKGKKLKVTGKLKAAVQVTESKKGAKFNLVKMFAPKSYVVRVYVLRAHNLMPKDSNGFSDPYLEVLWSDKKEDRINDRDNHKEMTLNPGFYRVFEIPLEIPGQSMLTINVWDWDMGIGGDDLIGGTVIDLEHRLFSDKWKAMNPKPIEYRQLYNTGSSIPQGKLEMWLEIMTPEEAKATAPTAIGPPEPKDAELRLIIWDAWNLTPKDTDGDEPKNDAFVTAKIGELKEQETEIHWVCKEGDTAVFNWRMVFPLQIPMEKSRLRLQVWDKDLVGSNDLIAEASIDLKKFFNRCYKKDETQLMEDQTLTLLHPNFEGPQGKLRFSLAVVPSHEAEAQKAGVGRSSPNKYPTLEEPERPEYSVDPRRVDKKVGAWAKGKIWEQIKKRIIAIVLSALTSLLVALWWLHIWPFSPDGPLKMVPHL